ncbi:MAG: DNA repair exonuclease [Planctomycetota bacterium]
MSETIKFIHASDFHLDTAMSGLVELPNHLIDVLANAPYKAAEKIFDTAIAERVDFVLLAGDLFDLDAGNARSAAFLLSQFERLAQKEIMVYWVAGSCDQPDRWPGSIELPSNVVTFNSSLIERLEHKRNGKTVARIMAAGFDSKRRSGNDFVAPNNDIFNIALTHGELESSTLNGTHIRYWALGGRHKSAKLEKPDTIVVYPGTPQGRCPKESGVHGFKICRVDSSGKLRVQSLEADRVRFMPQKVAISEQVQLPELKNELAERALKIIADTTDQIVLSSWYLSTDGDFNPGIRKSAWKGEVLEWLRDEFGRSDRGLWSLAVDVEAPRQLPIEWYEEDTLLGEFLRATGRYQSDESLKLNLHDYMPQTVNNKVTTGMTEVMLSDREEVLRRATMVGVEYLGKHKEYDSEASAEA